MVGVDGVVDWLHELAVNFVGDDVDVVAVGFVEGIRCARGVGDMSGLTARGFNRGHRRAASSRITKCQAGDEC